MVWEVDVSHVYVSRASKTPVCKYDWNIKAMAALPAPLAVV
jgi:regulator of PEP synthase PpsR (kinase-PPPase family)